MKILKYVLIAIAVLIVAYIGYGLTKPSVTYVTSVTVNRPLAETWEIYKDTTGFRQWIPGFVSIDLVSGLEGQLGAKYKLKVKSGDTVLEFAETVTSNDINKRFAFSLENAIATGSIEVTFVANGNNTDMLCSTTINGKGPFMAPLFILQKGTMKAETKKEFDDFKTYAEAYNPVLSAPLAALFAPIDGFINKTDGRGGMNINCIPQPERCLLLLFNGANWNESGIRHKIVLTDLDTTRHLVTPLPAGEYAITIYPKAGASFQHWPKVDQMFPVPEYNIYALEPAVNRAEVDQFWLDLVKAAKLCK